MSTAKQILGRIEAKEGKTLDLNNHRQRIRFFGALEREFDKRDKIIANVKDVLNGYSTYDESKFKVIADSRKK